MVSRQQNSSQKNSFFRMWAAGFVALLVICFFLLYLFDKTLIDAILLGILDYLLLGFPLWLPSAAFGFIGGLVLPLFTTIRTVYLGAGIVGLFLFVNAWAMVYAAFSRPGMFQLKHAGVVATAAGLTAIACILIAVSIGVGAYKLIKLMKLKRK